MRLRLAERLLSERGHSTLTGEELEFARDERVHFLLGETPSNFELLAEELRIREAAQVTHALGRDCCVILKGLALGLDLYSSPILRPRLDIDVLLSPSRTDDFLIRTMTDLGYQTHRQLESCNEIQFSKIDTFGVEHVFDFHFSLSNRVRFQPVLSVDEVFKTSRRVNLKGYEFLIPSRQHLWEHAVIHLVGHHPGDELLVWLYDLFLLKPQIERSSEDPELKAAEDQVDGLLDFYFGRTNSNQISAGTWRFTSEVTKLMDDFRNLEGLRAKVQFIQTLMCPDEAFLKQWSQKRVLRYRSRSLAIVVRLIFGLRRCQDFRFRAWR